MILDEFLRKSGLADRLAEHERWQEQQRQQALTGFLPAIPAALKVAASGPGLLLEGLGNVGKLGGGIGLAGVGRLAPGMSELTDAAAREYERLGGFAPGTENDAGVQARALMGAHEAAAGVNPYITGVMDMLTDPTNLLPIGPANRAVDAAQARIAARGAAGAELSPEFTRTLYDSPAGPRRPTGEDKRAAKEFAKSLELDERLNDAQANVAHIFARGGYAEQLQDIGSRLRAAEAEKNVAETMFRQTKESQKEFVRAALEKQPWEGGVNFSPAGGEVAGAIDEAAVGLGAPRGLGPVPEDNYVKPLSAYADTVYREMDVGRAIQVLDPRFDNQLGKIYLSNTPDLALGQGDNKGIRFEFDASLIEGQVNRSMPTWKPAWEAGVAEFTSQDTTSRRLYDAMRSLTISDTLGGTPGERTRLKKLVSGLRDAGWNVEKVEGGTRITKPTTPVEVVESPTTTPLAAVTQPTSRQPEEDAKAWFQELMEQDGLEAGVDFPKAGQGFGSFMDDKNQPYFQLRRAEEKLRSRIESALSGDELDLLNPWDKELVPGVKDTRKAADRKAFRSAELGRINERYNADELADTPVAEGDELFALSDGPFSAAPPDSDQAIRETTRTIVNAKPMPTAPEAAPLVTVPGDWEGSFTGRMGEVARFIAVEMKKTAEESAKRPYASAGEVVRAVPGMWKAMLVENPRNWFMDRIFNGLLLKHEGIGNSIYNSAEKQLLTRIVKGKENQARLFGGVADIGLIHEWPELIDDAVSKETNKAFEKSIGGSLVDLELDNAMQLNAIQQFGVNAVLGLANPTRAVTNAALLPLGALGEVRSRVFRIFNNVTHLAARSLAFEAAYNPYIENSAKRLLDAAELEGLDVSSLRGLPLESLGRTVGAEGGFSPSMAASVLGERYGAEWKRMIGAAREAGFAETKRVFGDYAKRGPVERAIAPFFPFMSWAWRAYPRIGSMLVQHPALLAGMYQFYRLSTQNDRAEGRKGYQYGTVGVDTETPLLGLFVSLFTPEQEGEVRVNPFSLFSPLGGEQIGTLSGSEPERGNETLYQQLDQLAGIGGMSFNPLVQAGAYVAGWDYKSPSPLSRYAPIDQVVDEIAPGLPGNDIPTLQGPLRGAREFVGKMQGESRKDTYDPVERKARELVYEETGKPVSDKSNNKLAAEIRDRGPIYQRAERLVDTGGATRAGFNTFSPLSVMSNTETGEEIRKARANAPFTSTDVYAAKEAGANTLANLIQAEIDAYKKANPAAAAQDRPAYIR